MLQFSTPEELECRFVHQAYEEIAPGFKNTRYKAWPCVAQFLRSQPRGSFIADIGCGTGNYLGIPTDSFITGSDSCSKFVEIAREQHHDVAVCDNLKLPYRGNCFDAVISVGVIHHLASSRRRLRAIQELARILRPGGTLMVCVWAMEQKHRKFNGQDVLVPYRHQKNRARRRAQFHQKQNLRNQSPKQPSKLVHDELNLRRSKSCSTLYDSCQTTERPDSNPRGSTEDLSLAFNTEFRLLKELVTSLKNRKEQLITSLNAQVVKLHSEKDSGRINSLLSKFIRKLFDDGMEQEKKKSGKAKDKQGPETGIPNIPNLLSALVKRLFKEKDGVTEDVQNVNFDIPACVEERNGSISTWSTIKAITDTPCVDNIEMCAFSRAGSFDSECSETEIDFSKELNDLPEQPFANSQSPSLPAHTIGRCTGESESSSPDLSSNKLTLHFLARLVESLSSSSDTDSDGSISPDLFNSDSGISDSEQLGHIDAPCQTKTSTPVCCNNAESSLETICTCAAGEQAPKSRALQRFYHVFREGELTELITGSVPSVEVIKEFYNHGNWVVVVEKL